MKVTYYGHSTFMFEVNGTKLLFDPFITGNELAKDIDISTIHPDYILVTHAHEDHILDVEAIAKQSGATVISVYEIANYFDQKDSVQATIPMNMGGIMTLPDTDIEIKMVVAVHTSSYPDGSFAGSPCGFVIRTPDICVYYSGDTALTYDMKIIGQQFMLDYAFLCMGDHFTMGPNCAVKAAEFAGADKIIAMHFDTFDPIKLDKELAIRLFKETGKSLKIPQIGEVFEI